LKGSERRHGYVHFSLLPLKQRDSLKSIYEPFRRSFSFDVLLRDPSELFENDIFYFQF